MNIKLFLNMKNTLAEGKYNPDQNSILVKKGAIIEQD
jgi:hypothetical protein